MNVNPAGLSFVEWADRVTEQVPGAPRAGRVGWQQWALDLIAIPSIATKTPPNPVGYADWSHWAMDFNLVVEL